MTTKTLDYEYDPDSARMTMGEHLEELRDRLFRGLAGMLIAAIGCFIYGKKVVVFFIRPLTDEMIKQKLSPTIITTELGQGFMVYIKISLICAGVIAAPWMLYQLWQFVAAGLYPKERKYITKYIPLSIGLLITGMLFVYYLILPWSITFFLVFNSGVELPHAAHPHVLTTMPAGLPVAPILAGDPPAPTPGMFWFNKEESRLKFYFDPNDVRTIPFAPSSLINPMINLPEYIDLVLMTLVMFGLCFQLPLVVLALTKIGIVDIPTLKKGRRYVYFGLAVLSATMTPGDVITAMIALMAPLVILYEFGILLAGWNPPDPADALD